jgi:glycosyltransferase involved in cell wall biosynthesis
MGGEVQRGVRDRDRGLPALRWPPPLRIAVYTDYAYRRSEGAIYAERAFAIFLTELARHCERFVLVGRVSDEVGEPRYRIPDSIEFAPLPFYRALSRPLEAGGALAGSLRRFWRVLDRVEVVWVLGPHPLAIAFAALAALRRRRVVLGVRQDLPSYLAARHPGRTSLRLAGSALELVFRALSRHCATVVVGPALATGYRRARSLHELTVSLVRESDVVAEPAPAPDPDAEWTVLSVGRLEEEKNPLLLAEVLAGLCDRGEAWRLVVCGEGPLERELAERATELGVGERAELRGYLPFERLRELYLESDCLLHVSWTEGLPQVLLEALAAGLPVVATDVGGVRGAVGEVAALVPPGDAEAAVAALLRLRGDRALRERLIRRGLERARRHTIESETSALAAFLSAPPP